MIITEFTTQGNKPTPVFDCALQIISSSGAGGLEIARTVSTVAAVKSQLSPLESFLLSLAMLLACLINLASTCSELLAPLSRLNRGSGRRVAFYLSMYISISLSLSLSLSLPLSIYICIICIYMRV